MKLNKVDLNNIDELYGGTEKIKKDGKKKQSRNDKNVQKSQDMPADWREGDSYIGRKKKKRNRNL